MQINNTTTRTPANAASHLRGQLMPSTLKSTLGDTFAKATSTLRFGVGKFTTEEAAERIEQLTRTLKTESEKNLAPEEYTALIQALSGFHLTAQTLRSLRQPEDAQQTQLSDVLQPRLMTWKPLAAIAAKVALLVGLMWALFTGQLLIVSILFVVAYVLLDIFTWYVSLQLSPPASTSVQPATPRLLSGSDLEAHSQQAVSQLDALLQRYHQCLSDVRTLREQVQSRSKSASIPAGASMAQKLLGACRRQHPDLAQMVEDYCSTILADEGLKAVNIGQNMALAELFDQQTADASRDTKSHIELYPAIVSINGGQVLLRGRVIVPSVTKIH
jgi:hypothetical protein